MAIIETHNLSFDYIRRDDEGNVTGITRAVNDVNLSVERGEFIAILGGNGSGKSTLAKHINAILYPTEGYVLVDGKRTSEEENIWSIRQQAGMIFQNPDNQIIGSVVEEDVGFGPENMGIPSKEIWERVEESLKTLGMWEYRKHSPMRLSGGQKQRVAIAGVVAMHPKCIIMDEPTAMLDPVGRKDVIRAARALNDVEKVTVILITHYMEEAIYADRIFVMEKGEVRMAGSPKEIFSRVEELEQLRLDIPQATRLAYELKKKGMDRLSGCVLSEEELIREISRCYPAAYDVNTVYDAGEVSQTRIDGTDDGMPAIILDHVDYVYNEGMPDEIKALDDVSFEIRKGDYVGLIGHTGSGKSTLVQHLDGLLKASSGHIYFNGEDIYDSDYDMRGLRGKVGLVFQYPEHQLFEETVFKDVCFGPKNIGLSDKEAELSAYAALKAVKLPDEYYFVSPFDLSGGQKRRVAIAGVLAMKPEVLVLDEPTAGLDPEGRDEILGLVNELHEEQGITIVLVSHSMEDVAEYAERIIVMDKGRVFMNGTPREVFYHAARLETIGLAAPRVTYIMRGLKRAGFNVDPSAITISEATDSVLEAVDL
ncbi:MAG: energy-coupling factor transporter ATPase [Lachnospiraceae bacterium]|nr:energy-coupling factor transporter ATPase [Lachnospiraceae bacterium]